MDKYYLYAGILCVVLLMIEMAYFVWAFHQELKRESLPKMLKDGLANVFGASKYE